MSVSATQILPQTTRSLPKPPLASPAQSNSTQLTPAQAFTEIQLKATRVAIAEICEVAAMLNFNLI